MSILFYVNFIWTYKNNLPKNKDDLQMSYLHQHALNYAHSVSVDIKEYEDKIRFAGNGIENITSIEVI